MALEQEANLGYFEPLLARKERKFSQEVQFIRYNSLRVAIWLVVSACLFHSLWYSDWVLGTLAIVLGVTTIFAGELPHWMLGICPTILLETILVESGSIAELLGAFLFPSIISKLYSGFLSGCHWRSHLLLGLIDVAALIHLKNVPIFNALFALAVHVAILAFVEKDTRIMWVMMDSYKKSAARHRNIIDQASQAIFIVNLQGKVVYANLKTRAFSENVHGQIDKILPPLCRQSLTNLLQAVVRGQAKSEEVILKPQLLKFDPRQLTEYALRLEGKPISWNQANCMILTVEDITDFLAKQILTFSRHKHAFSQLNISTWELERVYSKGEALRRVDLKRQLKALNELNKVSFLQMCMIGCAETAQVKFSPFEEALKTMELVVDKANEKKIEMTLSKNANLPQVVRGNIEAASLLLSCVAEFCVFESVIGELLEISLQTSAFLGHIQRVQYTVKFITSRMTTDRLHEIFLAKHPTLESITQIIAKYGTTLSIFNSVLQSVGGALEDAYVQEGALSNGILSYRYLLASIPFSKEEHLLGLVCSPHLEYTHHMVNSRTVKWPIAFNPIGFSSIQPRQDGTLSTVDTQSKSIYKSSSFTRSIPSFVDEAKKTGVSKRVSFTDKVEILQIKDSSSDEPCLGE